MKAGKPQRHWTQAIGEWWLWRRAQRRIDAAFPGATVISDTRGKR